MDRLLTSSRPILFEGLGSTQLLVFSGSIFLDLCQVVLLELLSLGSGIRIPAAFLFFGYNLDLGFWGLCSATGLGLVSPSCTWMGRIA